MKNDPYQQFFKKAHDIKREPAASTTRMKIPQRDNGEDVLRAAMRMPSTRKKRKPPFPWKAVVGLVISLFCVGVYFMAPDFVERWMNKIEFRAMGQASAADKDTAPKADATPDRKSVV